jgi:hypothetical protein
MLPELKAEFCITGVKISKEETWTTGEFIQNTRLKRKQNGWCLSTNEVSQLDLTDLVKGLLQTLLPRADVITQISNTYDLRCEFCLVAYILDETPVINFDEDVIHNLSKLNAAIDIDIILTSEQ